MEAAEALSDTQLLDWLEEQVVDTIYLDDGRVIDVGGNSVRAVLRRVVLADALEARDTIKTCETCDHVFDGPSVEAVTVGVRPSITVSLTCSKCGIRKIDADTMS